MKKIILLLICLFLINCSNQIKLNKSKDIDIILPQAFLVIGEINNSVKYLVRNNSDYTYIIDPNGFYGKSYQLENGKLMQASILIKPGYYTRFDSVDCKRDLIILKPKESIFKTILLDSNNKSIYEYSKNKKYIEVIKSVHNQSTSKLLGCGDYMKKLELQGYKILEDSINAKIPLSTANISE